MITNELDSVHTIGSPKGGSIITRSLYIVATESWTCFLDFVLTSRAGKYFIHARQLSISPSSHYQVDRCMSSQLDTIFSLLIDDRSSFSPPPRLKRCNESQPHLQLQSKRDQFVFFFFGTPSNLIAFYLYFSLAFILLLLSLLVLVYLLDVGSQFPGLS